MSLLSLFFQYEDKKIYVCLQLYATRGRLFRDIVRYVLFGSYVNRNEGIVVGIYVYNGIDE